MCHIATLRFEGIEEIEAKAAATTRAEALGRLYDKMKKRGLIREFESNWGEYIPEDPEYRAISREYFIRHRRKIEEQQSCEIEVVKG